MSVSETETINVEVLKERFPSEVVNPYGEVLIIPSRLFQRGWEPALEAQGYKVFVGDYNGEVAFLVRLDKSKPKLPASVNSDACHASNKSKAEWKHWPPEEEQKLMSMVQQGKSLDEIAQALGRTSLAIQRKVRRMKRRGDGSSKPASVVATLNTPVVTDEDVVKEFLAAANEIYPKFPHVCRYLLNETSKMMEAQKNVRNLT